MIGYPKARARERGSPGGEGAGRSMSRITKTGPQKIVTQPPEEERQEDTSIHFKIPVPKGQKGLLALLTTLISLLSVDRFVAIVRGPEEITALRKEVEALSYKVDAIAARLGAYVPQSGPSSRLTR